VTQKKETLIAFAYQAGAKADGGLRSFFEIYSRLPMRRIIVTNIESEFTRQLQAAGCEVTLVRMREKVFRRGGLFAFLTQNLDRVGNTLRLARLVRRENAKLVHFNDHRAFWSGVLGARLGGAKVVLNVRDTLRPGSSPWKSRVALRLCDVFLVLSREMAERWTESLRPTTSDRRQAAKIKYIYSIVDLKRFRPVTHEQREALRDRLGIPKSACVVAYVGSFHYKKLQEAFIRNTIPALVSRVSRAHVYFVGDFDPVSNPFAEKCTDAVVELKLENHVTFFGYIPSPEDFYQAADIIALASEREGLPRCMIEAIACGTPVAAFDVCSVREILEGWQCGEAVDSNNYEALAAALSVPAQDPARADIWRKNGPAVAAKLFDADRNVKAHMELFQRIVDDASTNPRT